MKIFVDEKADLILHRRSTSKTLMPVPLQWCRRWLEPNHRYQLVFRRVETKSVGTHPRFDALDARGHPRCHAGEQHRAAQRARRPTSHRRKLACWNRAAPRCQWFPQITPWTESGRAPIPEGSRKWPSVPPQFRRWNEMALSSETRSILARVPGYSIGVGVDPEGSRGRQCQQRRWDQEDWAADMACISWSVYGSTIWPSRIEAIGKRISLFQLVLK